MRSVTLISSILVSIADWRKIRLYSRELRLDDAFILHSEPIPAPVVLLSPSGDDSLLVYTHENILYHYIITATSDTVRLVQAGQIAFHGIVRSPARVRAMTWILPDDQLRTYLCLQNIIGTYLALEDGDPSQDVATASVLFLVDGKLALLQPSTDEHDEQKYDMRILAQNVEYYIQMRDQPLPESSTDSEKESSPLTEEIAPEEAQIHRLRDSLWLSDGHNVCVWTDVQDMMRSSMMEAPHTIPSPIQVPVDFYPISVSLKRGIVLGVESEFIQRRGIGFAFFRIATRVRSQPPDSSSTPVD